MTMAMDPPIDPDAYQQMWRERDQVTVVTGIVFRVCTICGYESIGSPVYADEAHAAHVREQHFQG